MMSRVREEIQRRLIILQINKIRHERAAANLSSPDLQRYRASLVESWRRLAERKEQERKERAA